MQYTELCRPVRIPYGSGLYRNLCGASCWVAQEKVDGIRVLAEKRGLVTRHGKRLEPSRRLALDLGRLPEGWQIDGELLGGVLYAFDLVGWRDGSIMSDIKKMRLSTRIMRLNSLIDEFKFIIPIRTSANPDEAFSTWTKNGAEGIVLKCLADPYPPNDGAEWYKVKP